MTCREYGLQLDMRSLICSLCSTHDPRRQASVMASINPTCAPHLATCMYVCDSLGDTTLKLAKHAVSPPYSHMSGIGLAPCEATLRAHKVKARCGHLLRHSALCCQGVAISCGPLCSFECMAHRTQAHAPQSFTREHVCMVTI